MKNVSFTVSTFTSLFYSFISGLAGWVCLAACGLSLVAGVRLLPSRRRGLLTAVPALAAAPGLASRLSSGGFRASSPGGTRNLPGPQLERVSPALARGSSPRTTREGPAVASEGEKAPVPAPTPKVVPSPLFAPDSDLNHGGTSRRDVAPHPCGVSLPRSPHLPFCQRAAFVCFWGPGPTPGEKLGKAGLE